MAVVRRLAALSVSLYGGDKTPRLGFVNWWKLCGMESKNMPIELHVDNGCGLSPEDVSLLIGAQKNLVKERIRLLNRVADGVPVSSMGKIHETYKRRLEIDAAEYMIDIAIALVKRGNVSTVSELAKLFQIEVNYGNPYHKVEDKAKAAQDIIDLLQS